MANLINMVIEFLKRSPEQKFTARQLAHSIITNNKAEFAEKHANPRFATDKDFEAQVVAEIGARVKKILAKAPNVHTRDKPRPRLYYWADETAESDQPAVPPATIKQTKAPLFEHDLYPVLIEFLKTEHQLYSLRID
jgi:hypothetical protein